MMENIYFFIKKGILEKWDQRPGTRDTGTIRGTQDPGIFTSDPGLGTHRRDPDPGPLRGTRDLGPPPGTLSEKFTPTPLYQLYVIFFSFLSFAKILHSFLSQLCKYLQGPAEDDCLIIKPFSASIYIYNTMYLQSMMKRSQSLRGHPIIRCPKNTQQIDRGTPHAEA